jgi:hypothetical protein
VRATRTRRHRRADPQTRAWRGLFVAALLLSGGTVRADTAPTATDTTWSGLTDLVQVARDAGIHTETPTRVPMSALSSRDALLIVHPVHPLPTADLATFLRQGGRVALADDFGQGDQALRTFGIERHALPRIDPERRFRGNHNLLLATPELDHPLARGVSVLVTNHPAALGHDALAPVFALGGPDSAVVLSGAVGEGRLVAISDTSVLINNMLALDGNRDFARNLARYLIGEGGGTLYVVGSDAELSGRAVDLRHPLLSVNAALARIAELPLPRGAIVALSVMLASLLVIAAVSSFPGRAAYARRIEAPECMAGFAGRVRRHTERRPQLAGPLLTFKIEIEQLLTQRTATPEAMARMRTLLAQIDALLGGAQGTSPGVDSRRFSEIIATGRRILAELRSPPSTRA